MVVGSTARDHPTRAGKKEGTGPILGGASLPVAAMQTSGFPDSELAPIVPVNIFLLG